MLSLEYLTATLRMRKTSSIFDMDLSLPNMTGQSNGPPPPLCAVSIVSEDVSSAVQLNRNHHHHHVVDTQQHHPHHHQQSLLFGLCRSSRWLCSFATLLAFLVGVAVGIAVPTVLIAYWPISTAQSALSSTSAARLSSTSNLSSATLNNELGDAVLTSLESPDSALSPFDSDGDWELRPTGSRPSYGHSKSAGDATPAQLQPKKWIKKSKYRPSSGGAVTFVDRAESSVENGEDEENGSNVATVVAVEEQAVRGIYWSATVENLLPPGFGDADAARWRDLTSSSPVTRVDEGCGRMQNRLITFDNGTRSCCRYRQNVDQIQGEIFTFYLSQLIGLRNLPPSALGLVRPNERQWSAVQGAVSSAQWLEDRPIVYTKFLDNLEPAYIPMQLRGPNRKLSPAQVRSHRVHQVASDRDELLNLAQWSDLVVLDYLTANLDRVVNNMYNMQWNPAMMDSPAHNLARDPSTGLLVFLDNESGLLHGYRLLDKYETYHRSLLEAVCVFRKQTVDALRDFQARRDIGAQMRHLFESQHRPLVDFLPFLPEKNVKVLNQRIDAVLEHVNMCQSTYGSVH